MKEIRRAQPIYPPSLPKSPVSFYPDIEKPETWFKQAQELPTLPPLFPLKKEPEPLKLEDIIPSASLNPSAEPSPFQPLKLSDPFTVNPLMSLFTTQKPLKIPSFPELKGIPVHKTENLPIFHKPIIPMQDPFYNPLFPNRKTKLFDLFTPPSPST